MHLSEDTKAEKAKRLHAIRWPNGAASVKERILDSIMADPNSGCWLWEKGIAHNGYSRIKISKGLTVSAHRASYEAFVGPIPEGLEIDHKCRVRSCVNPDHLECVTRTENARRAAPYNRKDACKYGHSFSPENTKWRTDMPYGRICRKCVSVRSASERAKRFLSDGK